MSFGVYVHVPYCREICPYCSFNVARKKGELPERALATAVGHEFLANAHRFAGPIKTIYFGGGTPSLMAPSFFARVLQKLRGRHRIDPSCEITVEVEPATVDEAILREYRTLGINRLSIGWQSQQQTTLQTLGRHHDAAQARQTLAQARAAGFDNISLDWLIAVPEQSDASLHDDARALLAAAPQHISCYTLIIEPRTPFARRVAKQTMVAPGDDLQARHLRYAASVLQRAGYRRYEVSSFAKVGRQSRHNRAYWTGRPYLGVGPGAHSFAHAQWRQPLRWQSERRIAAYLETWREPAARLPAEAMPQHAVLDPLTELDVARERVLVGLRRTSGISLKERPLRGYANVLDSAAQQLVARKWATRRGQRIVPTALGLLHADAAAQLLLMDV